LVVQLPSPQQALALLERLPDSEDKVYASIDLANYWQVDGDANKQDPARVEQLLNNAISIARHLQDSRSESFALGQLGHIYERRGDYKTALHLTQQAQLAAEQNLNAHDSLYTNSPKLGYRWYTSSVGCCNSRWQAFTSYRFRKALRS